MTIPIDQPRQCHRQRIPLTVVTHCDIIVAMRKYVLLGVPGSGKSTQSAMLGRDFDLVRISAGEIFRWQVRHHTKIGARVEQVMATGHLIGDPLVEKVMRDRLEQHDWNYGFVIDGFPRNLRQAEFYLESYDLDAAIYLEVPDALVRRRVLSRRLCDRCGADHTLLTSGSNRTGGSRREDICEVCAGQLVTREDDTPEVLATRIHDHRKDIDRVLDVLRRRTRVSVVDASHDLDSVQHEIRARLGLLPPQTPGDGSAGPVEEAG
jgi:adenylate kinase